MAKIVISGQIWKICGNILRNEEVVRAVPGAGTKADTLPSGFVRGGGRKVPFGQEWNSEELVD